ncbi:LpqB family beta-propeller domain-containing protein [Jiangella sp. DSM 45060]|uniref:LpqB family beta-propeller domain-containing protein n=1 Tax=Jiangella sp. DSM 45060 TaxID=1798224 RepID=UPI00087D50A5|nr:LpqB family beta-propeller domain-containing protein [Jiangella sp. DSM 45060]SDT48532.1 Dipeptidyl aminopeptidase/acylaminoacyl peptidase [Jiangella sp. DSM 45060]
MTPDDVLALTVPAEPALSPDGARVAYVLKGSDGEADENVSSLWLAEAGAEPRRLTHGRADASPAWSPDGSRLAFLRAADGPPQLWLLPMSGGGEPVALTDLPKGAGAPVWSPDGARIAFAAAVDTTGQQDTDPIVIDRLRYKADGAGLLRGLRQHAHVVDVATGEVTQLTDGDWSCGSPAWSPDGTRLAFPATTAADADLTMESSVYVLAADGGPLGEPAGELRAAGPVTWTRDGGALLVVGQREPAVAHQRLFRVPLDGGPAVDLTADLDRNVMAGGPGYPGGLPQLAGAGDTVVFCARDRGCTHVYAVDDGPVRPLLGGAGRVVSGLSVAGDRAAVVVAGHGSYGEVVLVDVGTGAETTLTAHSPADLDLPVAEERVFTISDGTEVHGWLHRPAGTGATPLLLDIHGGPHNAWSPVPDVGHSYHQLLVQQGWSVLLLNPRASDGYGEAFFSAAAGQWGRADERDFLEPLDQLVAEGVADPDRLAVTGYSYGGYMTCWLTGRTDRFAAAIPGGSLTDITSFAGSSDAGHYLAAFETAVPFADPEGAAAQSPYTNVANVTTPTLLLHGLNDDRCPPEQAEQWFAALRARGVAAQLVLYPGASHLFILAGRPSHRLDYARRIVDWVTQHTSKKESPMTTTTPSLDAAHWQQRLNELAEKYRVPGATLGIARGDETLELAFGVTNVDTGVEVTTDTLFQIGSITKVWTATVVMALADAGKLDLDEPVVTYLPELKLADDDATARVTMRHLLTHTSGIDGDFFLDTGRGDDCLEKYVAALAGLPLNHPLGATWSYCNSGFTTAGRVIEKLTGQTWDAAMRELLYTPLGLTHTVTLPDDALLYRTAVGHVHEEDEPYRRAPVWVLPRSAGPAGLIAATVADVLAFARMHLAGGVAADGTRVLAEGTAAAMREEQVRLPDPYTLADSWGLGWFRLDWNGTRLFGHDGNTIGQSAFLRVLPDQEVAVTLLTNGGHTRDLYETLIREICRDVAGVEMTTPLEPPAEPVDVDVTPHVGTYERTSMRLDVWEAETGPKLRLTSTSELAGLDDEPKELDLVPVRDGLYVTRLPGNETWMPVTFYQLADGTPYMHLGVRATPKVS